MLIVVIIERFRFFSTNDVIGSTLFPHELMQEKAFVEANFFHEGMLFLSSTLIYLVLYSHIPPLSFLAGEVRKRTVAILTALIPYTK